MQPATVYSRDRCITGIHGMDEILRGGIPYGSTVLAAGTCGSGKTTLGMALLKLQSSSGEIIFDGINIKKINKKDMRSLRKMMQIVFQDPFGSLSPRMSVNQIVAEGYDFLQTAPSNYRLAQSYPNPFTTGGTTIEFDLPVTDTITMNILDIRGRKVRTLIDREQLFGYQAIMWDAKDDDGENVSSGVYFYQIKSRNFNEVGKLVFVK
mgnify:CR=1 FL=1